MATPAVESRIQQGIAAYHSNDFTRAKVLFEEAATHARTHGDRIAEGRALANLGAIHVVTRNDGAAITFYSRALNLFVGEGQQERRVRALEQLSYALLRAGRYPRAKERLQELERESKSAALTGRARTLLKRLDRVLKQTGGENCSDAATLSEHQRTLFDVWDSDSPSCGTVWTGYTLRDVPFHAVLRRVEDGKEDIDECLSALKVRRSRALLHAVAVGVVAQHAADVDIYGAVSSRSTQHMYIYMALCRRAARSRCIYIWRHCYMTRDIVLVSSLCPRYRDCGLCYVTALLCVLPLPSMPTLCCRRCWAWMTGFPGTP